ncbi:NAD(P)/FAD-dependent oxidoreductase [Filimonas lacunae]|nr:NAD(P)/FAD-dependent oxidoreductase [Filimonas lacunae]
MRMVIIGGGFAGLQLARRLNNKEGVEVLLIDRFNYHQFQPLFYQVATGGLDASNISFPLRKVFHNSKNVRIRLAEVKNISPNTNTVHTDIGDFEYDTLVVATGAGTNFFGNSNLEKHAYPMKSTTEALQLRHHLIHNFEDALNATPDELQQILNIVVVGAGPTGVEVSGTLAEMKNDILPKDYPEIDFSKMQIFLLEGSNHTLLNMSDKSKEQSQRYLEQLGVNVQLNTIVKDYDGSHVTLTNGERISTRTVIWAAGIKGNVPMGIDPDLVVRGNRIKVDRQNKVLGYYNVYAIGDIASMETPKYPNGHPQLANVAINQGKTLATNILNRVKNPNAPLIDFEYKDKGNMATVGRNKAVVDLPKPKIHFGGFFAWLVWMGLHLVLILGVKNRMQIFLNWIYKYFTFDQSLRLLFQDFYKNRKAGN